jgi:HJR/Mrr/RecB family endonuclease
MNTDKSTPVAVKYFENLGYKTEIIEKRGDGFDFWIMKDGVKTTVEAKGTAHFILPKQIKALENGGVLAVVDGDKVRVLNFKDIGNFRPALFRFDII